MLLIFKNWIFKNFKINNCFFLIKLIIIFLALANIEYIVIYKYTLVVLILENIHAFILIKALLITQTRTNLLWAIFIYLISLIHYNIINLLLDIALEIQTVVVWLSILLCLSKVNVCYCCVTLGLIVIIHTEIIIFLIQLRVGLFLLAYEVWMLLWDRLYLLKSVFWRERVLLVGLIIWMV